MLSWVVQDAADVVATMKVKKEVQPQVLMALQIGVMDMIQIMEA